MKRLVTATALLALTACAPGNPGEPTTSNPQTEPTVEASDPASSTSAESTPGEDPSQSSEPPTVTAGDLTEDFAVTEHETFDEPWAMAFLPGTDRMLVTQRGGALVQREADGTHREVARMPEVHAAGQGGLHDVIASPEFDEDGLIYLSWVELSPNGPRGLVAEAEYNHYDAALGQMRVLWQQDIVEGDGHFALRLLRHDDHLYITSGDRQQMEPAQDMHSNLGKVHRISLDGEPADGNPFGTEGVAGTVWTVGHRNPLGIDADSEGNIWVTEMGPKGGDELNLLSPGLNYGWPQLSMGEHYDGTAIPDHDGETGFAAPSVYWVPSLSPANLEIHSGALFEDWEDSALIGGLSGERLVRVTLGDEPAIAEEWATGTRIRAVEEGPDGALWLLTDGADGQLLELRPA